jgi:hypothetical protein
VPPDFDLSGPDAVAYCPSCGYGYTARATRCARCDVALISRAEAEAARREAERSAPDETDEETEETGVLCELEDTKVLAGLLSIALWEAGVPCLFRGRTHAEAGVPVLQCRVPIRYLDEARRILAQVEERGRAHPAG